MKKVTDLSKFRHAPDRLTMSVEVKLTPSEYKNLGSFVEFLHAHGVPQATRQGAARGLVVDGLEAYREVTDEH